MSIKTLVLQVEATLQRDYPRLEKVLEWVVLAVIVVGAFFAGMDYNTPGARQKADIQEWLLTRELKKCVQELIEERQRQGVYPPLRPPRGNRTILL